jgi:hypothetical protein
MKMAAMKLGNTPRPVAWSPPLASFPPPALILATSSSNSPPHLVVAVFLVNGVGRMICSMWRRTEEEAINKRTPRAKGVSNRARSGLGRSAQAGRPRPAGPGPFRSGSAPVSSPVASRVIPYLCALACGDLTSFPSWLRLESLLSMLRHFLVESLKTCMLTLQSSSHSESCSSRVLTLVGLHDLLQKCLVNLS